MTQTTGPEDRQADVIVIGGGLAGLTATALVARAGRSVIVLERSARLGGRAATHVRADARLNLGPHAIYRGGHAFRVLRDLDVPFSGRFPVPHKSFLFAGDAAYRLPSGLWSLATSRLLGAREKWRMARLLSTLPRLDTRPLDRTPLSDWVGREAGTGPLAGVLLALFRLGTYAHDPERLSAGAALDQLKLALAENVWYLDGGWQTLVDGLRDRAARHGTAVRTGAQVGSVGGDGEGVTVRLADGGVLTGGAAVLAVGPDAACTLLGLPADAPLARRVAAGVPVRASCLDVALDRLPRPGHDFALGTDRPLYYSVHSASARLAPDGVAVVHAMKYLGNDRAADGGELEAFLDKLQPGWAGHAVARQALPGMTVSHALPLASEGGLAGRPGVAAAGEGHPNVFLAGDWVGGRGMLADASAASAEEAAGLALAALAASPARPGRRPSRVGA